MSILSEQIYAGDVLKSEVGLSHLMSREQITMLSGSGVVIAGTVLGRIALGALTSAVKASGSNTGNGVVTLDPTTPVLANATTGLYTARVTVAGTNSATFRVTDPDGVVLGDFAYSGSGAVGSFADRIKFTVTDGSTDFIVGDGFDLTVAAGSLKYAPLSLTATDGTQNAAGVQLFKVDATSADVSTVAAVRNGVLSSGHLVWPGGITAGQQAAATAQLNALGLTIRTEV